MSRLSRRCPECGAGYIRRDDVTFPGWYCTNGHGSTRLDGTAVREEYARSRRFVTRQRIEYMVSGAIIAAFVIAALVIAGIIVL